MQILKKLVFPALVPMLVGATLFIAACNNGGGGGNNGGGGAQPTPAAPGAPAASGYATTPQPCNTQGNNPNCINQSGYGYSGYQQHILPQSWTHGAWQWPTQWQPQSANCGCQSNYQAVYHQSFGMACAPQAYFNNNNYGGGSGGGVGYSYAAYGISVGIFFNWGASYGPPVNNQNLNIPQTYYGGNNACSGNTVPAQGCNARNRYSCSANYLCQPVGAGSTIGVCVRDEFY